MKYFNRFCPHSTEGSSYTFNFDFRFLSHILGFNDTCYHTVDQHFTTSSLSKSSNDKLPCCNYTDYNTMKCVNERPRDCL